MAGPKGSVYQEIHRFLQGDKLVPERCLGNVISEVSSPGHY